DCPAGTDILENVNSKLKVVFNPFCEGKPETILLKGTLIVERDAGKPGFPPTNPQEEPGNSDHLIETEIVSMVMTGNGITLRAGVDEGITPASTGTITELENDPTRAESVFNVYFEADIPGIGIIFNKEPKLMAKIIDVVPPETDDYEYPEPPMFLYNEDDEVVACLKGASHAIILDSFKAKAKNNGQVKIKWSTGTEENNASFQVWRAIPLDGECSTDPNNYIEVEAVTPRIDSKGTAVSGATYDYTDSGLMAGETYCYALSDEDYDGNTTYHLEEAQKVIVK
ncbi:MAG: hypothetical protein SVR94_19815, partial [Pseudomonadota bacterium]|nr:hypothetical protein [Pseudomonadota bacterium]